MSHRLLVISPSVPDDASMQRITEEVPVCKILVNEGFSPFMFEDHKVDADKQHQSLCTNMEERLSFEESRKSQSHSVLNQRGCPCARVLDPPSREVRSLMFQTSLLYGVEAGSAQSEQKTD